MPLALLLCLAFSCQQQGEKVETEREAKVLTIRKIIEEAWNKSNLDVLDELFASDYVYHIPPLPDVEGLKAYKQRIASYRNAFPDLQITIDEIAIEGNTAAFR